MSGADWLRGVRPKPKQPKKLQRAPTPLELDQVEKFLEDVAGEGKQLAAGLKSAITALDAIKKSGLTGEALVVLVTEKCGRTSAGGRVSQATVQAVLEALFKLGEYLR